MRRPLLYYIAAILIMAPVATWPATVPATGTIEVYFSPRGGPTAAIVKEIEEARSEILVQAYSFTSKPIMKALLSAKRRGVSVEAVLDKSNVTGKYSAATFLANEGIPVLIDANHAIAHNKVMIIDRKTLITGSFNFTKAAEEKNAENLLIFHGNHELANLYLQNYAYHRSHSTPYSR